MLVSKGEKTRLSILSEAPVARRAAKRSTILPMIINPRVAFLMVIMDSSIARGRVRTSRTIITGLPYGNPSRKMGRFLRFIFCVGKSLAYHSPGKWCLCA